MGDSGGGARLLLLGWRHADGGRTSSTFWGFPVAAGSIWPLMSTSLGDGYGERENHRRHGGDANSLTVQMMLMNKWPDRLHDGPNNDEVGATDRCLQISSPPPMKLTAGRWCGTE